MHKKYKVGDYVTTVGTLPTRWGKVVKAITANTLYVRWDDGTFEIVPNFRVAPLIRERRLYHRNPVVNALYVIIYWPIDQLEYYWERIRN